jgi:hypothetical protein
MDWADMEAEAKALLKAHDALERESTDVDGLDEPALKQLHRIHLATNIICSSGNRRREFQRGTLSKYSSGRRM